VRVNDVNERGPRYVVRRVQLPASGIESFTVIGAGGDLFEGLDRGVARLLRGLEPLLRANEVLLELGAQALFGVERRLRAAVLELGSLARSMAAWRSSSAWGTCSSACVRSRSASCARDAAGLLRLLGPFKRLTGQLSGLARGRLRRRLCRYGGVRAEKRVLGGALGFLGPRLRVAAAGFGLLLAL
jgi:hypothetical protein